MKHIECMNREGEYGGGGGGVASSQVIMFYEAQSISIQGVASSQVICTMKHAVSEYRGGLISSDFARVVCKYESIWPHLT